MNIQEIKDEILKHMLGDYLNIKIPFYLIQNAIYSVKDKSNMDIGTLDYSTIYFYQVTEGCKALLSHLNLELDYETDENGNAINPLDAFEMYREIYEYVDNHDMGVFAVYEAILGEEKILAKESYIQLGMFESKIVNLIERATTQFEKLTDKKQLSGILKTIKKELPELGELLKANKVEK